MHLVCKFIPGSKLTENELQFVLTPDECIGQLSRMRKLSDVLSQLPKSLSEQLAPSAKKDLHSLFIAIKNQLSSAQWVATSPLNRKAPISQAQLKATPKFAALIESVSGSQTGQVHKAAYQMVTDDVPLPRVMTYTPVTPSPDHKIVVEFAGQWPSNAACLMLGKTEAQKEKVTVSRVDHDHKHRSLATFKDLENEPKTLYIRIPCPGQPTPILLKLAEDLTPVDKDTKMDEWDNVLVPILPVKPQGSDYQLFNSGYLYIVWDNKLWRELEISDRSYFVDTDVDYYRNAEPTSSMKMRHANINGATLIEDYYLGCEPFEIYQNGKNVFSGELAIDETARVFGLIEEEVELRFPNLEKDPITIPTFESPFKAGRNDQRVGQGIPLPHIWVPYKIAGEQQSECYIHYSSTQLTLSQISDLENDPSVIATPLSELVSYSDNQSFNDAGEVIAPLKQIDTAYIGSGLNNAQCETNIAAVKLSSGELPSIRYRYEPGVDQEDDFFALRNRDQEWMAKSYFRSAHQDEDGYRTFYFAFPPEDVETVDLVRGAHSNVGNGTQHLILIEQDIPVSELLG